MAKKVRGEDVEALKRKAGPRSGFVRVVLYVEPEQLAALQDLARERAESARALRPDVSEAARVVLSKWLAKR
jgi:hypothetical protein